MLLTINGRLVAIQGSLLVLADDTPPDSEPAFDAAVFDLTVFDAA